LTATLWRYTPVLLLAALWEAVTVSGLLPESALPRLSDVAVALGRLLGEDLLYQTGVSLMRGGTALGLAILVGTAAGVFMARYLPVRVVVKPFVQCFYPMPKSALIPLAIMWLGLGDVSKITLIFIGCLLPITVSAFNATRGVDEVLLWSARSLGAREGAVLREVILPAALPEILSGIRVALALSFIMMVSAELIIANNGIGFLIGTLGEVGEYEGMFAGVVTISLVGFLADRGYGLLVRRILIWRE